VGWRYDDFLVEKERGSKEGEICEDKKG